jgi:hypothetical protein
VDRAQWAGIIEEIRAASNQLPQCRFMHVGRDANIVAHKASEKRLGKT